MIRCGYSSCGVVIAEDAFGVTAITKACFCYFCFKLAILFGGTTDKHRRVQTKGYKHLKKIPLEF